MLPDSHFAKAESFERFAVKLDPTDAHDQPWIITAKSYAAVHYVDAFLLNAMKIGAFDNHAHRKAAMKQYSAQTGRIYREYLSLEGASRRARYDVLTDVVAELENADSKFRALREWMRRILNRPE